MKSIILRGPQQSELYVLINKMTFINCHFIADQKLGRVRVSLRFIPSRCVCLLSQAVLVVDQGWVWQYCLLLCGSFGQWSADHIMGSGHQTGKQFWGSFPKNHRNRFLGSPSEHHAQGGVRPPIIHMGMTIQPSLLYLNHHYPNWSHTVKSLLYTNSQIIRQWILQYYITHCPRLVHYSKGLLNNTDNFNPNCRLVL